jgi:hypothetical protein
MNFREWLGKVLFEDDAVRIREAESSEIPKLFIHATEDPKDIESIRSQGFDLKKFGATRKKFGSPKFLWQHDPKGIYALAYTGQTGETRPYLIFSTDIKRAIILEDKAAHSDTKEALSKLFGGKTGSALSQALLRAGYQAVLRPGSEQIILDPTLIKVENGTVH